MTETSNLDEVTMQAALAFARTKPVEWDYFLATYVAQHPAEPTPTATVEPTADVTGEPEMGDRVDVEEAPERAVKRRRGS